MSYDQLSSLESGQQGGYSDSPGFQALQHDLKKRLQTLLSSNRKLANDVNILGTKKDTPRLRERVHNSMEKTRDLCRDIGEDVKKLQTWEDLTVRHGLPNVPRMTYTDPSTRDNRSTNRPRFRAISKRRYKSSNRYREQHLRRKRHQLTPRGQPKIPSCLKAVQR